MHEVALVGELVDAAVARSGGVPVTLVRVRRATTIPDDVLRQAFEMLVPGTPLEGATLERGHVRHPARLPVRFRRGPGA